MQVKPSEEAQLVRAVAHEQVLGLLVVVEHHLVVLAADAGLLVAAEGRMRGVGVVAVGPHAACLDAAAHAEGARAVAAPHAGAQAVERVVGDLQRFLLGLEGGDGHHRAEDFLLEDAHLVVALEHRGLDVVAAGQVAAEHVALAADQAFGTFLLAQVQVRENLLQLFLRGLRADHGALVERVALGDGGHALQGAFHEAVVDRFLDQHAAGAGADLALVQREHGEAFQRLVEEGVVGAHHILEEDVGALAAQLQRDRDDVLAGVLHDEPAGGGLAREGDLRDAVAGRQRLAGLQAEAVDHVQHARGQQVADHLEQDQDGGRRLLRGLEHHAVAGSQGGCQLPDGHQDREVPGNDLAHDAQRLVEVVGHGVMVDLADAAFLRPHGAREVAEVVDGQRNVGRHGLAQRLAVVDGFSHRDGQQVGFHAVGDLQQDVGPVRRGGLAPGRLGLVRGVQRGVHVLVVGTRNRGEHLAVDGRAVLEVLAVHRRNPLAADVVAVLLLVGVGDAEVGDFCHVHGACLLW